jgi:hypothetical protein
MLSSRSTIAVAELDVVAALGERVLRHADVVVAEHDDRAGDPCEQLPRALCSRRPASAGRP